MDFEDAAARLARDQSKLRGHRPVVVSQKAKRQAEYQRKQQQKLREERERKKLQVEYQQRYWKRCERSLHVKSLGVNGTNLQLKPTSVHGDGDKITLPPSVLETLTNGDFTDNNTAGNPWTFRIGLLNPNYQFPKSPLIEQLQPSIDDEDMMDDDSDNNDDEDDKFAYRDELAHKYLSYTHCTVVEFTQEEGHVGIPQHVATALLDLQNRLPHHGSVDVPVTRTLDPASVSDNKNEGEEDMSSDGSEPTGPLTPGHVAWGAFEIPDMPLEIALVQLPKGRGCTLVPTKEAVQKGFYNLQDVKLVLEQSLIRTRATLSIGDVVSTWHRGVQYDLNVTTVIPKAYPAVTCINTDIEVDIGETKTDDTDATDSPMSETKIEDKGGQRLGGGYTLGSSGSSPITKANHSPQLSSSTSDLLSEPPPGQTENVVVIQIRYSGGNGKRRFDVTTARVQDLLRFAASLLGADTAGFQLVTRFPRRVLSMASHDRGQATLAAAGIASGQELFLVEML